MGKRKSKKRKNKLSRPPKKGKRQLPPLPPLISEEATPEVETELTGLDAPTAHPFSLQEKRPFGAVHPSLYGSRRYQKFRDKVLAIRAALPDELTHFATYDVPDLKDRQWLRIYAVKKEAGELPEWQQYILEKAGFNWAHGRPPRPKKAARKTQKRKTAQSQKEWLEKKNALAGACEAAKNPLLGLLCCDDKLYKWLQRQLTRLRSNKLSAERLEQLKTLPFDLEPLREDRGAGKWRTRFKAYATGQMSQPERWARAQARARAKGTLPKWRVEALNHLDFDWDILAKPERSSQERMEARWRSKLEHYLELQAASDEPGHPLPTEAAQSLRPWVSRMRAYYRKGLLRPEIVAEFQAKGFEFDGFQRLHEQWMEHYKKLCAFKEKFGHVRLPSAYVDDPELGQWLGHQKERMRKGKLRGEKLELLQKIGVNARERDSGDRAPKTHMSAWLKAFREIEAVLKKEHDGQLPRVGRFSEKHRSWLKRQRNKLKEGELEPWQIEKLEAIGFDPEWIPSARPHYDGAKITLSEDPDWADRIERLRRFISEYGHAKVPRGYPDRKLRAFVERIRNHKRKGTLTESELAELQALGFIFAPFEVVSPAWMRHYKTLQAYHEKHGHSNLPRAYPENQPLAEFIAQQRQRGRKGLLLAEHIRLLDALDFEWSGGRPQPKDQPPAS